MAEVIPSNLNTGPSGIVFYFIAKISLKTRQKCGTLIPAYHTCLEFIVCECSGQVIHRGMALPSTILYGIRETMCVILLDL